MEENTGKLYYIKDFYLPKDFEDYIVYLWFIHKNMSVELLIVLLAI